MSKKGQLQISFGMIFSLILIIATVAITGYVLVRFVIMKEGVDCSQFYDSVQKSVDSAWVGDGATFYPLKESVSSKIKNVCFGNISLPPNKYKSIYDEIKFRSSKDSNIFIYPIDSKICGNGPTSKRLDHISSSNFFCVQVKEGKITINISKSSTENLVTLLP
jgi:hypothetical protein